MNTQQLMNHVQGPLGAEVCQILHRYARDVPEDGTILDLNCGYGRSSISLALGLVEGNKDSVSIVSWDPHLVSSDEIDAKDGTLTAFVRNLRLFNVQHKVIPVIHSVRTIPSVLCKKSAHLVVAQVDTKRLSFSDSLGSVSDIAQHLVRKNGKIILVCHNPADEETFRAMSEAVFGKDYKLVQDFGLVRVFEYTANTASDTGGFTKATRTKTTKKDKK